MKDAFNFLRKIKSVAFATVENGKPCVRIADVMLVEDDKLYFLTARGKPYYKQLKENPHLAIVGMDENYVTVRVTGDIEFVDRSYVDKIFEANPMMNDLYPGEKREILDAFCMIRGVGEIFDLSVVPIERQRFDFGGSVVNPSGYSINEKCVACGICKSACPMNAISEDSIYKIDSTKCLECGRCFEACPNNAIIPPLGL
ncbi:4Fe-4S binding protein [Clostridium aestuarii]|uniref:Ferredoxin n=1 Tax=Clostridium aestuarii TaxID=338193 RepID=A0ABT4CVM4_9CLOT|nr:4Fe-4S binding protein [Clostridium aestuarii]MCY6483033.1 4Fe-4S binding protein [Clostridium aestuarii]